MPKADPGVAASRHDWQGKRREDRNRHRTRVRTANALDSLAWIRLQQHKYGQAEPLLQEALNGHEKSRADSWERYNSQSLLGASLEGQARYAEAEPLLIAGYQGIALHAASIPFDNKTVLQQAGDRILQLYRDWGKPEKFAEWRNKVQSSDTASLKE